MDRSRKKGGARSEQ